MKSHVLFACLGSLLLASCDSHTDKMPPKETFDEVAMRDGGGRRDSDEKPNMFDLRQDAMQEARTRGSVCEDEHYQYEQGYPQYYYYNDR